MRQRFIQAADRQQRREQHAVTRVELHHAELLHGTRAVARQQVAGHVARPAEPRPLVGQCQGAAAQLDRRHDPGGHGRPDARDALQLPFECACQPVYSPGLEEYPVRYVERALVLGSVTDYRGEQLVVAQPRRTQTPELLARPIVQSQMPYAHAARIFNPRTAFGPDRTTRRPLHRAPAIAAPPHPEFTARKAEAPSARAQRCPPNR